MKKKLLSIITCLALCLTLLPTAAFAASAAETGDFTIAATDGSTELIENTDYTYTTSKSGNNLTVKTTIPVTIGMRNGVTSTEDVIIIDTTNGNAAVTLDAVSINTSKVSLGAVVVSGDNDCTITAKGTSTIHTSYSSGSAIQLKSNATSDITINGTGILNLSNEGTGGNGVIYAATYGNGSLTIEGDVMVKATASDEDASGIERFGLTTIQGNAVVELTPGSKAYGIWSRNSCRGIVIGGEAQVTVNGGESGLHCKTSTDNQVTIKEKAIVTIKDVLKYGITGYGPVTIQDSAVVNISLAGTSASVHGIYADRSGQNLTVTDNAKVTVRNSENGKFSRGLRADGKVIINQDAVIEITGGTNQGITANNGVEISGNAQITLKEMKYGMSGGVTIGNAAVVTISDTTDRAILNKFTISPATGKAYKVDTGADATTSTTNYYAELTSDLSDSSAKYFHAEPTDVRLVTVTGFSVEGKPYDGTAVSYTGTAVVAPAVSNPTFSYTWYEDSVTESNKLAEAPKDAGKYILVVAVTNAGYAGQQEIEFEIKPKKLTTTDLEYTGSAITKEYDGTTDCSLTSVSVKDGVLVGDDSLTINGTAVYNDADVKDADKVIFTPNAITTGNYTLAATETLEIAASITPKAISSEIADIADQSYTGNQIIPALTVTGDNKTLTKDTDYTVVPGANVNVADGGSVTVKAVTNGNYTFEDVSANFNIIKADYTGTKTSNTTAMYGNAGSFDLATLNLPEGYVLGTPSAASNDILSGAPTLDGSVLKFELLNNAENLDETVAITVPVTSADNYNGFDIVITVTVSAKNAQKQFAFDISEKEAVYGDQFTVATTGAADGSTVSYFSSNTDVATVDANGVVTVLKVGETTITATAAETATHAQATASYELKVNQKELTITVADKSAYVGSQKPDLSLAEAGTDYTVSGLVGSDTVTVALSYVTEPDMSKAGEYGITAAGTDASVNYTFDVVDGKLTVSNRPSSGSSSNTTTKTEKNEDGSTTTTTTNKSTGTVTETTKYPDGSTTTVVTTKDGAVTTTEKTADGVTGTVVTDKKGNVTDVSAAVPTAAAKDAEKTGEAVTLPIEVEATDDAEDAVEIDIDVPSGGAKVEIPVEDVTPGTVVVIVNKDGTEEIVKTSVVSKNGVVVTLDKDATIKVIDNSKYFVDVHPVDHWATDAIDFVVAREIYSGTSATTFHPDNAMTRGMLAVVLHNLECNPGHDFEGTFLDVAEGSWYEDAIHWAADNGIVSGYGNGLYGPNDNITREQLAVMLWRYAGSPESDHSLDHFVDADQISGYARAALAWANENGIINGKGGGILDPKGNATRAQVAQMLKNYLFSQNN